MKFVPFFNLNNPIKIKWLWLLIFPFLLFVGARVAHGTTMFFPNSEQGIQGEESADSLKSALRENMIQADGFPLSPFNPWTSEDEADSKIVAWGDVDGDGDLDLAVGNYGTGNKVYLNHDGELETAADNPWTSNDSDQTRSIAWGDVDGDGDLDLAVGNELGTNKVYLNQGGVLQSDTNNIWESNDSDATHSVAWGDVDGDGDLDLAAGNYGVSSKVYLNQNGTLQATASWVSGGNDSTTSVAWGDVDGDGDLDLAVGNYGSDNKVFLNQNGVLQTNVNISWVSKDVDNTRSVAWGDINGDGHLDLATGNEGNANKVYLNLGGVLQTNDDNPWDSDDNDPTLSIAFGDVDGDGDLDLAAGNHGLTMAVDNKVYLNEDGILLGNVDNPWSPRDGNFTNSVAWGDVDGDGDLDLTFGNNGDENKIYWNQNGVLQTDVDGFWNSGDNNDTYSVAWGDVNRDGYLDLAVGNSGSANKVYLNQNGVLQTAANNPWNSGDNNDTRSVAWGDVDGDGDLDLAVGNYGSANKVYLNQNGVLQTASSNPWNSGDSDNTTSVAWADVDGDGDLDLAVGNYGSANKIYYNENGVLQKSVSTQWLSDDRDDTLAIAWGDIDGDGDLDLAAGNDGSANKVYLNQNGILQTAEDHPWVSGDSDFTYSIALGDVDGDGDLDLAAGNSGDNKLYLNQGTRLQTAGYDVWTSGEDDGTFGIAWGDVDRDGDLDLATGNQGGINKLYQNGRVHDGLPNNTFFLKVDRPIAVAETSLYVPPELVDATVIPINYRLFDFKEGQVGRVTVEYSPNGGGQWFPAVATQNTFTTNLAASPWPDGTEHTYHWDTFASGFFGQSENLVIRMVVYPQPAIPATNGSYEYTDQAPFPIQRPYASATTFPFRVRGTQVQTVNDTTLNPVQDAIVYRVTAGLSGQLMVNEQTGEVFQTAADGYLAGRGEIQLGDQLLALKPVDPPSAIGFTDKISFFHTSAAPTANGLDLFTVEAPGVQQLKISADHQLMLLNLVVSLEWDASKDADYLAQLETDIGRASEILYDLTNGQVALGEITIYQNKEQWYEADIVISASNIQRPSANLGGIVEDVMSDQNGNGEEIPFAFLPGQIRMPPVWNRYGNPEGTIGEDWPRVLAHEIGHYALFMIDNYLGLDASGNLITIDCQGSAMTDAYRQDYSEFLTAAGWTGACLSSVAENATGRSDWETILYYYGSFLDSAQTTQTGNGPLRLPLAVTQVIFNNSDQVDPLLLEAPFYYLNDEAGRTLSLGRGQATGYLFQNQDTPTLEDDVIVSLGAPVEPLLQARGAHVGDTICVYDHSTSVPRTGCLNNLDDLDSTITLAELDSNWVPEIFVRPLNETSLQITVHQMGSGRLEIQVYPTYRPTDAVKALVQTVSPANGSYSANFEFPLTVFSGHVRVYEIGSAPRKETIIPFSITPKWNGNSFSAWGGNQIIGWNGNSFSGWGGNSFSGWGGNSFSAWGGNSFSAWGAPVVSSDGQVTLFDTENIIGGGHEPTPAAVMQAIQNPPHLPSWFTPVGQAYRYDTDDGTTSGLAILFSYLGRELPFVNEQTLTIYYLSDGATQWQQLATSVNTERNQASAAVQGVGTYALIATVELPPLLQGWNSFGYPLQETRPVALALESIAGEYTSIYQFTPQSESIWMLYDPTVADEYPELASYVNDLEELQFAETYLIHTTDAVTMYLGVPVSSIRTSNQQPVNYQPPATYYGYIESSDDLTVAAGMPIEAWIGDKVCGETMVDRLDEQDTQLVYKIQVSGDAENGCGQTGAMVSFFVDGQLYLQRPWDNRQANDLAPTKLFLPLVQR